MIEFTEGDRLTPLWAKLGPHIKQRIAALRRLNDSDADECGTAKTRGRISELKKLLALVDPKEAKESDASGA